MIVESQELLKLAQATNEAKHQADKLGLDFVSHLLMIALLEISQIEPSDREKELN